MSEMSFENLRSEIEEFEAGNPRYEHQLKAWSVAFLKSPYFSRATGLGWSQMEIFGMHPSPPLEAEKVSRCMGLIPALVMSRHRCKIVTLGSAGAIVETAGGALLAHPRRLLAPAEAVLWWKFRD